ncbi:methyltransferase family protein [Thermodesulfobacteriota bacterium]
MAGANQTLKHLRAILPLPGMVTVVVPATLTYTTDSLNVAWSLPAPICFLPPLLGLGLILFGLVLMSKTIALFARVGRGTLAPWDPTQRLVVQGIYRHVRNPMISGVLFVLLGEAVLLGSMPVMVWFLLFLAVNLVYIPFSEEPGLEQRFGTDYVLYKKNVPRWLPRLTPWNLPPRDGESALSGQLRGSE